ncbi:hypothetical protein RJ55_06722 [Drechmeria coniospora]|nr:hypothetical protein RJ55_06722 [Drechmeria coniospora]
MKACQGSLGIVSPSARNVTERACQTAAGSKVAEFIGINVAFGLATTFVVGVRLGYRLFFGARRGHFGVDDYLILLASPIALAELGCLFGGLSRHGLGRDVWALDASSVVAFGLYFYVVELMYLVLLTLIKLTLSVFYLQIFPGERVRYLLWGTIVFHGALGLAFLVKAVFQCRPISWNWDKYDTVGAGGPPRGSCVNIHASGWANAVINVASDFWLIALPLSQVSKLSLHWKKKIGAAFMFGTGLLVTIVSMLRLNSLASYANTTNPTWDQYGVVVWSAVEVNVGMICTCLPTLRLVLLRIFPRIMGNDTRLQKYTVRYGSSRRSDGPARHPAEVALEAGSDADADLDAGFTNKMAFSTTTPTDDVGSGDIADERPRTSADARTNARTTVGEEAVWVERRQKAGSSTDVATMVGQVAAIR